MLNFPSKQSGAVGACWAHNPEVDGSKPSSAILFLLSRYLHVHVYYTDVVHVKLILPCISCTCTVHIICTILYTLNEHLHVYLYVCIIHSTTTNFHKSPKPDTTYIYCTCSTHSYSNTCSTQHNYNDNIALSPSIHLLFHLGHHLFLLLSCTLDGHGSRATFGTEIRSAGNGQFDTKRGASVVAVPAAR